MAVTGHEPKAAIIYPPSYAADLASAFADMGKLAFSATAVITLRVVVPIVTVLSPHVPYNYCTSFMLPVKVSTGAEARIRSGPLCPNSPRHPDRVALPVVPNSACPLFADDIDRSIADVRCGIRAPCCPLRCPICGERGVEPRPI